MRKDFSDISVVLATDCGSTTTKAILFEKKSDGWHQTFRGEAPTTVEKPVADVTIGARNAFLEVQELSGRKIISDHATSESDASPLLIRTDKNSNEGIDLYVSTSSAGGGLQMIVAGVVSTITTESGERAALGAGAIVMDTIAIDDGREQYERVTKIRHLRPDIILIAGGTENGTTSHPLELAETILQADPRPRFGDTLKLPVIFAGNSRAQDDVRSILGDHFSVSVVDNIRPSIETENLRPTRDAIHDLFLHHVMSHAPGYRKLLSYSPVPIIPTPAAVGEMVLHAAKRWSLSILAVDIGGATTDVFSALQNGPGEELSFNRTVSANLGMSYSVANVLVESGDRNIRRWLPYRLSGRELRDRLRNKMIRPTSIPSTMDDLLLEQAVCREALRLAFIHHQRLAVGLKGIKHQRSIGDMFAEQGAESGFSKLKLDLIIGSGGVLSHAPNRKSAALMMLDAYEPIGVTRLAVDSIFMMPHLGVLSSVNPDAAAEIFVRDCLVDLGTVIAPLGSVKRGQPLFDVTLDGSKTITVRAGDLKIVPLATGENINALISPRAGHLDFGSGAGKVHKATLHGGPAGIILDGRGRPLLIPEEEAERVKEVSKWYEVFEIGNRNEIR